MGVDVAVDAAIARPRHEVAAVMFEPGDDPLWIGGVERARALGDGPLAVGSQVERTARFLGRRFDYVMEVMELRAGALLRMRSVRGPFPMEVAYSLADEGAGTRATVRVRGDAGGFFRLGAPLLGPMVRRSVAGDLRRLRRLVEARPAGA